MEEIDHRAIDLRFFTKDEEAWKEIDAEMKKRFPESEEKKEQTLKVKLVFL